MLFMLQTLLLTVARCYSKATECRCFDSRLSLLLLVQAKKRDPRIDFESEHTSKKLKVRSGPVVRALGPISRFDPESTAPTILGHSTKGVLHEKLDDVVPV